MESTRLTGRHLSSTRRKSRPVVADFGHHRPDLFGSVVHGEVSKASRADSPSPDPAAPSFPPEATWDGGRAREHTIDNSEPDKPEPDASTRSKEPAEDGATSRRGRGRWLGLLGAISGLLIFFALQGDHHHGTTPHPGVSGVGMPMTLPGNVPVKPLRIAVVLGDGLTPQAQTREVHTLESWLSDHVNPATRLTIVNTVDHMTTGALSPSDWASTTPDQRFQGTLANVLKRRLSIGRGHRVLVTFDHPDPLSEEGLAGLHLVAHAGADLPAAVPLRTGHTVTAAIDPGEIHAFAATTARSVISISNMLEGD